MAKHHFIGMTAGKSRSVARKVGDPTSGISIGAIALDRFGVYVHGAVTEAGETVFLVYTTDGNGENRKLVGLVRNTQRCRLCLDRPGKNGLGQPCLGCNGKGEIEGGVTFDWQGE